MLLRDLLDDGGSEFFGTEDLRVLLVAPVGHGAATEDRAALLNMGDPASESGTCLLFGEGVSNEVFRQGLLPVPAVAGDPIPGMNAETAVMPGHELLNKAIVDLALIPSAWPEL